MNTTSFTVEFHVKKNQRETERQLFLPKDVRSLCIVGDTKEFGLKDEQKNSYSDILTLNKDFVVIRFNPSKAGIYQVVVKGYDKNLKEIVVITLIGKCFLDNLKIIKSICLITGLLAGIVLSFYECTNYWVYTTQDVNKTLSKRPKTLLIGSTEKFIDSDVLLNRFQRYYDYKIDDETFSNKPIKELYRLLKSGKIDCIVTSISNVDTSSIYWSEVYAIDNTGGVGLRVGVLKTTSNVQLIREFNQ
ncbi:hypothetical protein [Arcicella rigui]|uniref:Uncharacterized protein n=1 Tax=Arcicella rigui TaxID=797020 RepID=A0ABU5Q8A5_9BACT|nr:hypothetical protein [Arcicella rigui]MEA5138624.1 hypothetical protein [Arcicella rigui]